MSPGRHRICYIVQHLYYFYLLPFLKLSSWKDISKERSEAEGEWVYDRISFAVDILDPAALLSVFQFERCYWFALSMLNCMIYIYVYRVLMDRRESIVAVFLDLKRAFETIYRPLLLCTLRRFGIVGRELS